MGLKLIYLVRRFANFDRLDRFFFPFRSFASCISFSLSFSFLAYVSFSLSFKILSSLLSLHILRYSQTLLADETRFVLNFLDRVFRTARKFVRLATRIVFGLHSHILAVNSRRYYTKRTTTVEHMLYQSSSILRISRSSDPSQWLLILM